MLLRQTTIKGGRLYNLLTHLGRRSLNNNATNSRQKSLLFVLRNNNNSRLISVPIVQQQQQQYGGQGGNYSYKSNQAAITTAAAFAASTAAIITAASSTDEDDPTNRNLTSAQKIFANSNSNNSNICHCEEATTNPKQQTTNEITATSSTSSNNEEEDNLPTYTMSQVSNYNGQLSPTNPNKRIWMSYGGMVYDVTEFIANHPGGSEKILMGAGGAIEPYWYCEFDCCVVGVVVCYMLFRGWKVGVVGDVVFSCSLQFRCHLIVMYTMFFISRRSPLSQSLSHSTNNKHSIPTTLCIRPTNDPPFQNAHWETPPIRSRTYR
jgi:hypothetical protein